MIPRGDLAHHSPGRTRFRVPSKSWDQEYFFKAKSLLQNQAGISGVKISPMAASIVIFHDLDLAHLKQLLKEHGILQAIDRTANAQQNFESALQAAGHNIDREVRNVTGGEIDLKSIIAFGYFGLSLVQLRRKSFLPAAWVLAVQGFDTLKQRA